VRHALAAAGPDICARGNLERVHNIAIAPTILKILDVTLSETIQDRPMNLCAENSHR
jgi:hypothetical protein